MVLVNCGNSVEQLMSIAGSEILGGIELELMGWYLRVAVALSGLTGPDQVERVRLIKLTTVDRESEREERGWITDGMI